MALTGVNRYADMIKSIIDGPFYESRGTVVPYRHGNTDIRLKADFPNTVYALNLNEVYEGTVTSDSQGNVVFSRHLSLGDNEIVLTNLTTGYRISSWLTTREYAVWLISYAEAFESIDDDWQEAQHDLSIETVTPNGIEDRFGQDLGLYNIYGQDHDAYRWMLHEVRNAFRDYGGKVRGVESAVASLAQIGPFGYARRFWGPNWVLDQSMLANHRLLERSCEASFSGAGISGVTFEGVEADVIEGTPSMGMQYDVLTKSLRWGDFFTPGPWVRATEGSLFLPGPPYTVDPFIMGLAGPFSLTLVKRLLRLNIGAGTVEIDLSLCPGYPAPTAAQVAAYINVVMGAVVASVYNGKLLLSYAATWIRVEPCPRNAAVELFGVDPGDLVFAEHGILDGVSFAEISNPIDISVDSVFEYEYDGTVSPPTQRFRWGSPGGTWPPGFGWVSITGDGTYTLTDALGKLLVVRCLIDDVPTYGALSVTQTLSFSVNYTRTSRRVMQTKGAFVHVTESLLPAVNSFDTVDVRGDASPLNPEAPDRWWVGSWNPGATGVFEPSMVDTDRAGDYRPSSAFRYHFTDAVATSVDVYAHALQYPNPQPDKGCSYPQKNPGLLYDYEGFEAKFSGWFLSHDATVLTVELSFSFDDGVSWISGAPSAINTDAGGLGIEEPTYLEFSAIIPSYVTESRVLVRMHIDRGVAGVSFSIDCPHIDIKYITSRCLGNTTVARNRHRQYFGELLYLWSPEPLNLAEQTCLGLQHKSASPSSLLAGVVVAVISADTPTGAGVFEYEYNSVGPTKRIRWSSSAGAWAPGLGWVVVPSDGSYTLPSPDGSSMVVDVLYDILPLLSGTPPAAVSTRSVTISDITTDQGLVRRISPAHESLDIFDATEYDTSGLPLNLKGSISEVDFSAASLINLEIQPASPFRYSFLKPTVLPIEGESLAFAALPPHTASLLYESDQDMTEAVLFEDGISVPNNLWKFDASNLVRIINPADYNPAAVYTINYNPLFQITTPYIDLGGAFQDYAWFADFMMWDRMEHDPVSRLSTVPLYFKRDNGRAGLPRRSDMAKAAATLYYEAADGSVQVAAINWRFLDPFTVEMDPTGFIDGAQYFLTHGEVRIYPTSSLTVLFEHRSGVNTAACMLAPWLAISRNENVYVHQPTGGHVVHQLRLSVSSIRDLRDFRIRSVVLKGLHIHGALPSLQGLTNV
jgi:hypothetical protein